MANSPSDTSGDDVPSNIPGLTTAREAVEVLGQLGRANLDSCNKAWREMRQGELTFNSLLGHYGGMVERYWQDLGRLVRAPLVDTDRPDWIIFWYDVNKYDPTKPDLNMVKSVTLGRRYPSTIQLHCTPLQMLGQNERIPTSNYAATLGDDGVTLTVLLRQIPPSSSLGDYVGLVTTQAQSTPLAVVMVTVEKGPVT